MSVAAIKIAQKQAHLADPEYRALLRRVGGVSSAKELDEQTGRRVLAELYRIINDNARIDNSTPAAVIERTPAEKKLWKLWYELEKLLPNTMRNPDYFLGMVRRASGVPTLVSLMRLKDLTPYQMHKTIEALKQRLAQEEDSLAASVGATSPEVPF